MHLVCVAHACINIYVDNSRMNKWIVQVYQQHVSARYAHRAFFRIRARTNNMLHTNYDRIVGHTLRSRGNNVDVKS